MRTQSITYAATTTLLSKFLLISLQFILRLTTSHSTSHKPQILSLFRFELLDRIKFLNLILLLLNLNRSVQIMAIFAYISQIFLTIKHTIFLRRRNLHNMLLTLYLHIAPPQIPQLSIIITTLIITITTIHLPNIIEIIIRLYKILIIIRVIRIMINHFLFERTSLNTIY